MIDRNKQPVEEFVVYIVDDDSEVANAIKLLVHSIGLPARVFGSAQEFLDDYEPEMPSCLILDVRMPGMSGPKLQELMLDRQHQLPTIFVTGHGDIPTAVQATKRGAIDVLEKPFNDQVLIDRIFEAKQKDTAWRHLRQSKRENTERLASLTAREKQVLGLILKGKANKRIAADLELSTRTVEVHRANIMKKLKVSSVADLVKRSLETGSGQPADT